jgi:hypothetical protein
MISISLTLPLCEIHEIHEILEIYETYRRTLNLISIISLISIINLRQGRAETYRKKATPNSPLDGLNLDKPGYYQGEPLDYKSVYEVFT